MAQHPVSFRWDMPFLARLDEARGGTPRSTYVRRAVEAWMGSEGYEVWDWVTRSQMKTRPGYPTVEKPGLPGPGGEEDASLIDVPAELMPLIDAKRGDKTRSEYVEWAMERELDRQEREAGESGEAA
jgi:hypothetical protein